MSSVSNHDIESIAASNDPRGYEPTTLDEAEYMEYLRQTLAAEYTDISANRGAVIKATTHAYDVGRYGFVRVVRAQAGPVRLEMSREQACELLTALENVLLREEEVAEGCEVQE